MVPRFRHHRQARVFLLALGACALFGCRKPSTGREKEETGIEAGAPVVDGEAFSLDGKPIRIASLFGAKPTVLIVGSYTCPGFRGSVAHLKQLHRRFGAVADFDMLYIREAHAAGEPDNPDINLVEKVSYTRPQTMAERIVIAKDFAQRTDIQIPVVLDSMDEHLRKVYDTFEPNGLVIVENGIVQFRLGRHTKSDAPEVVAWLEHRFPNIPPLQGETAPDDQEWLLAK